MIGLEGVGAVEEGERLAPGTRVRVEFVHPGYGRDGAVAEYAVAPEEPDASSGARRRWWQLMRRRARRLAGAALGYVPVFTALMVPRARSGRARLDGAHVLRLARLARWALRGAAGR